MSNLRHQLLLKVFHEEYPYGDFYISDRRKAFELENTNGASFSETLIGEIENLLYFSPDRSHYEETFRKLLERHQSNKTDPTFKSTYIKE